MANQHFQVVAIASTVRIGSPFGGGLPHVAFCQGFPLCDTFFLFLFLFSGCYCCGVRERGSIEGFGNISLVAVASSRILFRIRSLLAQLPDFGFLSCVSGLEWLEKSSSWVTFWLRFGLCFEAFQATLFHLLLSLWSRHSALLGSRGSQCVVRDFYRLCCTADSTSFFLRSEVLKLRSLRVKRYAYPGREQVLRRSKLTAKIQR